MTGTGAPLPAAEPGAGQEEADLEPVDPGPPDAAPGALLALTSTELAVLEAAHLAGLVGCRPEPGRDEEDRWVEAIRSLTARGLLDRKGTIDGTTAAGEMAQTLLDVRLGAATMVVGERLLGDPGHRRDLRTLHLLPVGAVLEDVHPDGVHGLDLVLDPALLVRAVTDLIVPPDLGCHTQVAPGAPGPRPVVVHPGEVELLPALLGHPTVLAELTLVEQGARAEGHLVALGPAGCWAAAREEDPLRFVPVAADWVRSTVTGWVERVVERAADG
ncbi:hypothetical protein [Ornithinimicrobium flavum]|uniref:hypothetical protein n=1 Tax=Ornithinimicrobium flavum TaxID=1288636 RepID=UPI00106FD60A|nr:hypothetical protein [Ornithinimicrobium flavum]